MVRGKPPPRAFCADTTVGGRRYDLHFRVGAVAILASAPPLIYKPEWPFQRQSSASPGANSIRHADTTGVIVTHGTTTSEDTAFFLHLLAKTRKPVVLTNSQQQ
ncbi:MAG: asparaginase [Acidobacteria bacterium]|nr:asparaginase [Acidobacteriota bacterium]